MGLISMAEHVAAREARMDREASVRRRELAEGHPVLRPDFFKGSKRGFSNL